MKKCFASLSLLLLTTTIEALPVGNPREPALLPCGILFNDDEGCCYPVSGRLGFYGDYLFNRHLEVNESGFHKDIEETELFTNAAYLALCLWDRVEIFSTLGGTSLWMETNFSAFSPGSGFGIHGERVEIVTDTAFSWSLGLRGLLWEWGCLSFGAEAQYFRTSPTINRMVFTASDITNPSGLELRYQEWQVGVGAVYNFCAIAFPYAAVKIAHSYASFSDPTIFFATPTESLNLYDLKSSKWWGYAFGVNFLICGNATIGVEGRFGDETACYVNGSVRF